MAAAHNLTFHQKFCAAPDCRAMFFICSHCDRGFKDWNQVFPNATCIATLLDRLTHHAEIAIIEGKSYRVRESELESSARRKASSPDSKSASQS